MIALTVCFGLACWFLYHHFVGKRKSLPPGPIPLPLVGNMLQLDQKSPSKTFANYSKKYGPIFTFWFGNSPTIVVTDFKLIKEGLVKLGEAFSGRPQVKVFRLCQGGEWHGLVNSTGNLWKEQRRFSLQVLKNIGVGRNIMEQKIHYQINRMINHVGNLIGASNSTVINLNDLEIQWWIGNIISNVCIGHDFSKDAYNSLKGQIDRQFEIASKPEAAMLMHFPWLRHVPILGGFGYQSLQRHFKKMFEFMKGHIAECKRNHTLEEEATSYTQAYLQEMAKREKNGANLSTYSEYQLAASITDLWVAGMDTTVATLGWAFLFMIQYPDVQQKCQTELDRVFSGLDGKLLSMSDRTKTPYFTATVKEIQRKANILQINLPRSLIQDIEFAGYKFKKDLVFAFNISNVMSDPKIFPEPEQFKPERFLTDDEAGTQKSDSLIPFSLGKRACIGESLARMELYLIIGIVLQNFRFSVRPGCQLPTSDPEIGATLKVKPFDMLVERRN